MPALDVKVVPADTDRFGDGHGYNTSPSDGTPAAIASATGEDPRQGPAAGRGGARRAARTRCSGPTARSWPTGDPAQVKTIEDLALYAHGTGALPPGVEGGLDAQTVYRD